MTNILLVEDNDLAAGMIHRMFPAHHIDHVTTLGDALDHLETKRRPDIIFLDLNLPDSIGGDTYHAIRSQYPDIYTIVCTGVALDCHNCPLVPPNVKIVTKGSVDIFNQLKNINAMLDRLL